MKNGNIIEKIIYTGLPHISEISYDSYDISITKGSLSGFMGYNGDIPEPLDASLDELFEGIHDHLHPAGGFGIFKDINVEEDGFFCGGVFFETGMTIAGNLAGAEYIAMFMVTSGIGLDRWSAEAFGKDDAMLGYTIDCAGSEIAEDLADGIEKTLLGIAGGTNGEKFGITNRYSPGYCGWDVAEQQKLFSFFPEGFCGITLTSSSLMIPRKSISGVIGIGRKIKKNAYGCRICERENCILKKYRERIK
jgi:hypothetical protein